jgi:hexulose-6-phosphate isomerase
MIKSINQWSLSCASQLECLQTVKRCGFQGYEPAFNLEGELSFASYAADAAKLKKDAAELGVSLVSLASGLYWQYNFASPDAAVRAKAKDICRAQLDCAAMLGVDTILVVPAGVNAEISYADAYTYASEAFEELKEDAKRAGVCIGLENVWNNFLLSPLEYRDFIDSFKSEWIGMYFDVGNVLVQGFPQDWIKILGKRIKKVHIKDYKRSIGYFNGFVSLLEGDVDFAAVMSELRAVGYNSALTAEVFCHGTYKDVFPLHTSAAMDAFMK